MMMMMMMMISQFNGTSTPKGSYSAKTGDNVSNVCNVNSSIQSALYESIRYQAKSEQNVRQDIPRVRHGAAALMHPNNYNDIVLLQYPLGHCYLYTYKSDLMQVSN